jgi:hypothetical protein
MILACTLMAGIARLTGLDWLPPASCESDRPEGSLLAAAQAGGADGGAHRNVSCATRAITMPVTIIAIAARLSQETRRAQEFTVRGRGYAHQLGQARLWAPSFPRSAALVAVSFPAAGAVMPAAAGGDAAGGDAAGAIGSGGLDVPGTEASLDRGGSETPGTDRFGG